MTKANIMAARPLTMASSKSHISDSISDPTRGSASNPGGFLLRPMRLIEWAYIREALRTTGNDVPKAASILELSQSTIYRRIREFHNRIAAE